MGGLIPAALMDLNTLIVITINVIASVLGPLIIAISRGLYL